MKSIESDRQEQSQNGHRHVLCGWLLTLTTTSCVLSPVFHCNAQCTFSSGSTGTNGVFGPTNSMPSTGWSVTDNIVTVTNQPDGIFHFTSIYIETNWVVKFTRNTLNTPVYLLAQSNVTVRGTLDASGEDSPAGGGRGGQGGAGGYDGGSPGSDGGHLSPGFGPGGPCPNNGGAYSQIGGGPACTETNVGVPYGTLDLLPFIGGSGGGGAQYGSQPGGAGGGGAILIASSMTNDIQGTISCNGGNAVEGGGGSGGAIKLIARTIKGEGIIRAAGGSGGYFGSRNGSAGRIRLEACTINRVGFTGPPATFGNPTFVFLSTNPTIEVSSISGANTPAAPAGSLNNPDVYLPTNFTNPALISVASSNISVGTAFKIIVTPSYGTNLVGRGTLAGTYAFSSCVVTMAVYTDRVWRVNALIDYIARP